MKQIIKILQAFRTLFICSGQKIACLLIKNRMAIVQYLLRSMGAISLTLIFMTAVFMLFFMTFAYFAVYFPCKTDVFYHFSLKSSIAVASLILVIWLVLYSGVRIASLVGKGLRWLANGKLQVTIPIVLLLIFGYIYITMDAFHSFYGRMRFGRLIGEAGYYAGLACMFVGILKCHIACISAMMSKK